MTMRQIWRVLVLGSSLVALLAGCSKSFDSLLPDRRPDYRQSAVNSQPLEIPPDLTASTIDDTLAVPEISSPTGSASLATYAKERAASSTPQDVTVLPEQPGITVHREGQQQWLVVEAPVEQVWPKVRDFWISNGFALKRDDPNIGIMETDWLENRADIPQDGIRAVFGKYLGMLYSAPTRDKFRVRIERSADGKRSEVFMTHAGVEEVAMGGSGASTSSTYRWQQRPANPELEAEMLKRMALYLGASEKRAAAQAVSATPEVQRVQRVDEGGETRLLINEDYSRAWRMVGLALDSNNYAVEEQNRSQGLYVVEYRDPALEGSEAKDEGWLSKMAFWRSKADAPAPGTKYRVRLSGQGKHTVVVVRSADDQPDTSSGAQQLLEALQKTVR